MIAMWSIAALYLLTQPVPLQQWGSVVGLVAQPLWLYETWCARQWGMFLNSVLYTIVYVLAVWRWLV